MEIMMFVLMTLAAAAIFFRSIYSCLATQYNLSAELNLRVSATLFSFTCLLAIAACMILLHLTLGAAA